MACINRRAVVGESDIGPFEIMLVMAIKGSKGRSARTRLRLFLDRFLDVLKERLTPRRGDRRRRDNIMPQERAGR